MNLSLSTISFDEVFKRLSFSLSNIKKTTEPKTVDAIISRLKVICSSVVSDKPYKPLHVPEEYITQWNDYLLHNRMPQARAVRYLCWNPAIASDTKFIDYLHREQINLSARSLQGIVRACHFRWEAVLNESLFEKGSLLEMIRSMIANYKGPNRMLQKWNGSIDIVLSSNGPSLFATEMIKDFKIIKEHTESWAVEVQSEFFRSSMVHAVQQCRKDNSRSRYLFMELLTWQLWGNTEFKKIISDFILDNYFNNEPAREMLQNFILSDSKLGDPRLPRNKRNWIDIDADARNRFIEWLSQLDIVFFFEHVLPEGNDPHGRKEFWLRYIKIIKASRPMLCQVDADRLKTSSFLLKNKISIDHLGKIKTPNSVFLLDFGEIVAVEFSVVGACHVYKADVFRKILPDFWTKKGFNESYFKHPKKCIGRIVHNRGNRWKREMSNLLSKFGVRSG